MAKRSATTDKTILIGTEHFTVRDENAVSEFIDGVTEVRVMNGMCYVSFAQTFQDGANRPEVDIRVRLRMTVDVMEIVHAAFSRQIEAAKSIKKPTSN